MKHLLLLLTLLGCVACATRPAPIASDFEAEGLRHDAYVLQDASPARPVPSRGERVRLEAEWPPVDELSLPGDPSVRRVNSNRALIATTALRSCSKRLAKGEPCRGQASGPAPTGAVILRTAPNGYGAPGLELTTR